MKITLFSSLLGLLTAIGLILFSMSTGSVATPELFQPEDVALERALNELVTMPGGPPGAVALVQRGNDLRVYKAGVADIQTQQQISVTDSMRLASVSKAFSGAVALSLVSKGLLSLDDTIGERLPSLPQAWAPVTLRQLLAHTSGLPNFTQSDAYLAALSAAPTTPVAPSDLLGFVADKGLEFLPGSQYQYSNSDNIAASLMVEAATGLTYVEELQQMVFSPLGLTQTTLPVSALLPTPFIHGYDVQSQPPEDLSEILAAGWTGASGGIVSTPADLNQFMRGYAGGKLFDSDIQAQQFEVIPDGNSEPPGPGANAAGLGIFRYQTRCGTVYGHTGNIFGYTQFAAATRNGRRSVSVSVSEQLNPNLKPDVFAKLRRVEEDAVCVVLRPR
ncbi:MAG: beta-lactamase family protein [Chroococcidiopsidaceae cyanobacterium CP_BM_RX_35]|nr:beta-lactamase family protein [Chroococcidiopsidaceae cyanobacterium CP_BM_RX_35]